MALGSGFYCCEVSTFVIKEELAVNYTTGTALQLLHSVESRLAKESAWNQSLWREVMNG